MMRVLAVSAGCRQKRLGSSIQGKCSSAAIAAATLFAAPGPPTAAAPRGSGAVGFRDSAAEAGAVAGVTGKAAPGAGLVLPLLGDEEVATGEFCFCFLGGICRAADACLSGCDWGVFCTVTGARGRNPAAGRLSTNKMVGAKWRWRAPRVLPRAAACRFVWMTRASFRRAKNSNFELPEGGG